MKAKKVQEEITVEISMTLDEAKILSSVAFLLGRNLRYVAGVTNNWELSFEGKKVMNQLNELFSENSIGPNGSLTWDRIDTVVY